MSTPFPDATPDSVPAEPQQPAAAPAPQTHPPATPSTGDRPSKPHKFRRFHIVPNQKNRRPNREQLEAQARILTQVANGAALLLQMSTTKAVKLEGAPLHTAEEAKADEPLSGLLEVAVRFCIDHPAAVLIAAGTAWLVTEIERKHGKRR
jgi:predicted component of type VI protein secretion system